MKAAGIPTGQDEAKSTPVWENHRGQLINATAGPIKESFNPTPTPRPKPTQSKPSGLS